jgi:glycine dehydrogenase subunit 1
MPFVPHSEADVREMLAEVGVSDLAELYADIPADLILDGPLDVPEALSEWEAVRRVEELAARNPTAICFAGGGIYDHHVPAVVDHIIRRSEFYTAYTPYQPEVAQGTLQAIYEFQTMVCELTGMEVSNASIYDGATSTGEAALMAMAVTRRSGIVYPGSLHPHYRKVVHNYVSGIGAAIQRVEAGEDGLLDRAAVAAAIGDDTACVIVQSPNFFGLIEDLEAAAEAAHQAGALLIAVVDPLSLALLRPPGEQGADIVVGEGQPFGNAPNYGGPVVGIFAAREKFVRQMPGRIVGATTDVEGRRGYVLTLQTREQQIRRGKATSNICTNQGLNMLAATVYLATIGPAGLRRVAELSARNAHYAFDRIAGLDGVRPLYPDTPFFREFAVETDEDSRAILERGLQRGVLAGVSLSRFPELGAPDGLLIACTEKRNRADIDLLVEVIKG